MKYYAITDKKNYFLCERAIHGYQVVESNDTFS